MIKFEFNYDGSELISKGEATLLQVAQDICNKAGVELSSTSFLNSDKKVSVYDNTVTAREYLSYIAESAGCFACIDRKGKLCFREFGQDETEIPLEMFGEYKWGEEFKISKVSYEDGVRSFKFGDDTKNNLWINQENMYIVDEDQVQKIYNKIKGLTANTFEGKTIIDPAIDIGDKIVINGKNVIYQGEMSLEGMFIAQISSKIQIKQKEETTVKKESQKVVNRRVQSRIDQAEGKIEQLVEKTTENSKKITKHEQDINGITQSVSEVKTEIKTVDGKADKAQSTANTAKNTADNTNNNLTNNYYTKIQTENKITQTAESTISEVSKTYSTKTETSTAKTEAINSANANTDTKLQDYTVTSELGTFIEQNWEYIKYAWNQISQYLKMEGIDGKATLNIYDENNKMLMSLSQDGEIFYKDDKKIGSMGVIRNSDGKDELIISAELIDRDSGGVESNSIISFGAFDNNGNFLEAFRIEGIYGYTDFKWTSYITTNHLTATSLTALQEIIAKNSIVFGASLASGDDTGEIYTEPIDSTGNRAYIILKSTDGVKIKTDKYTGYVMHGIAEGHTYKCNWTGSQLQFWVDTTNVGTLSDKRLKTDIQDIDEDFIKAIEEIEMKQFKVANRNGLISFGILAQDLIEIFEKYNKNPFDYEIVQETQYKIDDETIYYTINYEQFLILKQKTTDKKLEQLQEKDKQKDELIQSLIQRIETLEKEVNK